VRVSGSTSVVLGDFCVLRERDHYHVRRLTVAPMPVLPPRAVAALARVAANPADESAVSAFQHAIRPLSEPAARVAEPGQVRVHLPANCRRVVDDSVGVVVGDCARVNAEHRYVLDESVLHLPDLLVRSRGLVRAYARAVAEPGAGERAFLARLVHEAGRSSDRELLAAAGGRAEEETTLFELFGVVEVEHAAGATVGVDNQIISSFTVVNPSARTPRVLKHLDAVRARVDGLRDERQPAEADPAYWPQSTGLPEDATELSGGRADSWYGTVSGRSPEEDAGGRVDSWYGPVPGRSPEEDGRADEPVSGPPPGDAGALAWGLPEWPLSLRGAGGADRSPRAVEHGHGGSQ